MLDSNSIEIYRKFVYGDNNVPKPIPQGLEALHEEMAALQKMAFYRSQLSDDGHTLAFMIWKHYSVEGRQFYDLPVDGNARRETSQEIAARLPKGAAVEVRVPDEEEYTGKVRGFGKGAQDTFVQVVPDDGRKTYLWVRACYLNIRGSNPQTAG